MENKNSNGLVVLVIILVIIVLGLGGFIVYDKVINVKPETKEVEEPVVDDVEETKEVKYDYSTIKGVYTFEGEADTNGFKDSYTIILSENGVYQYDAYKNVEEGQVGNYTIVGDEIHLNQLFSHGNDASLVVASGTKVLKINSENEIVDNNPEKILDGNEYSQISLKKDSSKEVKDFNDYFKNMTYFTDISQK